MISKAGKAVIAQKSLLDRDLPFRRFHRLAGRPRYAAELVRVLGDFQRYGIDTCDLYRAAGNDTTNADAASSATTEEPASVGSDVTPADRTTVITDATEATIFSGAGATRDKCFDFCTSQRDDGRRVFAPEPPRSRYDVAKTCRASQPTTASSPPFLFSKIPRFGY